MDTNTLLYISFVIYLMVMTLGYLFKVKWLYILAGLLWFIPITNIENVFLILISVIMLLAHLMLGLTQDEREEF